MKAIKDNQTKMAKLRIEKGVYSQDQNLNLSAQISTATLVTSTENVVVIPSSGVTVIATAEMKVESEIVFPEVPRFETNNASSSELFPGAVGECLRYI